MLGRIFIIGAVVAATWVYLAQRPAPPTFGEAEKTFLTGAFHVHSDASHDGKRDLAGIIAGALDANLDFVILTDHNVTSPEPIILDELTVLAYPEISTPYGHLIQMGQRHPLPKGDRNRLDVLEAMREHGASPVIAHPSRWRSPWEGSWNNPGGIEITNSASSIWRGGQALLNALLLTGPNPHLAEAMLYTRDTRSLERWDEYASPLTAGYCGVDAHGWLPTKYELDHWKIQLNIKVPTATDERPAAIKKALLEARFHCMAGFAKQNSGFLFEAHGQNGVLGVQGDSLEQRDILTLVATKPQGSHSLVLYRNGHEVVRTTADTLNYRAPLPGSYRVEITQRVPHPWLGSSPLPVVYSNKIQIRNASSADAL